MIAYGLIGAGVALAAIPIANVIQNNWQSLAVFVWGAALSLFVLITGLLYLTSEVSGGSVRNEADRLRICVLIVLGGVGLLTALLGFVLPFGQPPLSVTNYQNIFGGGVKAWRERANVWPLVRVAAALIGGLMLMFLGLVQARTFERTRPNLRRLMYGYNAIFSSMLLILIIGLLNLLPYSGVRPFSYANESIDWTRAGIHSLHPATKNVLTEMKQPVKVYLLGSSSDRVMFEMKTLLEKCQTINPQFTWEQLSRDRNPGDISGLMRKYQVPDSEGVLVVYGTKPDEVTDFIKTNDLFEAGGMGDARQRFVFKGENALVNALTYLSAGQSKATVYFTQGSGELAYNDRFATQPDVGMGALIEELGRVSYQTHELSVKANTDKIPEDADIVVIARPVRPMPENFLKALRDYLHGTGRKDNKKGKLVVLFDVVLEGGKDVMARTGLEGLMGEYGVRVGDNEILNLQSANPLRMQGIADFRSTNPIARAFSNEAEGTTSVFFFEKVRTVEASKANPPGMPAANSADNLVLTSPNLPIILQTDLSANPRALLREMLTDQKKLMQNLKESLPLAVTVSEGKTAAPPIPGHEGLGKEGQPRMVVFGDASWVSNRLLQQAAPNNFNLFTSCLSWLVERPDIGNRVPPSQHDIYRLKAPPNSGLRLLLLPGFLMVLGVLALGVGVWVVRRR